jgi:pimeloyl-ACP methyl ester carboxylesterase
MSISPFSLLSRIALRALLALIAAGSPAAAAAPATGFVDVPGGRLWYESRGTGTPVVFLHDGLLSSETWDDQVAAFSQMFRMIRYDRRGYGRSEPAQAPFSGVADLAAVFDRLELGRAVLVGCSSGGQLAVDFALAHPGRVEALVLVGPVVSGLPYSEHFLQRVLELRRPLVREKDVAKAIDAWVRDPYLIAGGNTRAKERLRELLTRDSRQLTSPGAQLQSPERPPALGRLAEIRVPALIVVGASDIPDVHSHSGALEAGIAGSRRVVLAGAGHLVHMEIPERFNETVLAFLRPDDAAAEWLRSLQGSRVAEEHGGLLDYDASAPLDVKEAGSEERGAARVVDLSYTSPQGGRVPAFLILPKTAGRHPAVLFVHPGQGDRSTFLEEGVELAGRGIASLLIGAPHTRGGAASNPLDAGATRREWLQLMIDVRRGFDLLAARPEVDPARLAYVGHSLGATAGGAIAGHERRPVAWVLMAGYPSLTHAMSHNSGGLSVAFRTLLSPEEQRTFLETLAPLDSVYWIGRAAPAKLLFQFARRDEFITPFDAAAYTQAAGESKEVRWYDTDHFFNDEARKDRIEWLARTLIPALRSREAGSDPRRANT